MPNIELLDPKSTTEALANVHGGASSALLTQLSDNIMAVLDSESSVWVAGLLTESTINSLRTRMYRRDVQITVRKVTRDGNKGHVITARSIDQSAR